MILGILGSQIEIEKVFFIVDNLTSLRHCKFGPKNLDLLILLIKNWLDDHTIGFEVKKGPQDVDDFGKVEEEILNLLDIKFLDGVEDHVEK